ncbi:hypothetical protein [Lysinibacillus fusiformis]|uniref:hypothetical protein n=1 Tax=Lysinibacillus fusiformis TaxID=28031 RepID=UPI003CFCA574
MELKNMENELKEIIFNPEHENFWLNWKETLYVYENVGKSKKYINDFLYLGKEASNAQYNLKVTLEKEGVLTKEHIEINSPEDYIYFFTTLFLHWESNPKRNTPFFCRATISFRKKYARYPNNNIKDFNLLLGTTLMTVSEWLEEIYWINYIDELIIDKNIPPENFSQLRTPGSKNLLFTERNMKHIIEGDLGFSKAPYFISEQKIIKGGLHTVNEFEKFLSDREENDSNFYMLDIDYFSSYAEQKYLESDQEKNPLTYTYYLKKAIKEKHYIDKMLLSNGVEVHKIPRELVNAKQWKMISISPYKTLFPKELGSSEIQNIIHQVVKNPYIILSQRSWCTTYIGEGIWNHNQKQKRIWLSVTIKNENKEVITAFPTINQPNDIFEKVTFKRVMYRTEDLEKGEEKFKVFIKGLTKNVLYPDKDIPFPVPKINEKMQNIGLKLYSDRPIGDSVEFIDIQRNLVISYQEILKKKNSLENKDLIFDFLNHISFRAPRLYISFLDSLKVNEVLDKLIDLSEHREGVIEGVTGPNNEILRVLLAKPMELLHHYDTIHHTTFSFDAASQFFRNFLYTYTPAYAIKASRDASDRMRILTEFSILNIERDSKIINKYIKLLLENRNFVSLFPIEVAKGLYLLLSFVDKNWDVNRIKYNLNNRLLFKLIKLWDKSIIEKLRNSMVIIATSSELNTWENVVKELYHSFNKFTSSKNEKQINEMSINFLEMFNNSKKKRMYGKAFFQYNETKLVDEWMISNVYDLEKSDFFVDYNNPNQSRMWVTNW